LVASPVVAGPAGRVAAVVPVRPDGPVPEVVAEAAAARRGGAMAAVLVALVAAVSL
jgi:hypothetical protein